MKFEFRPEDFPMPAQCSGDAWSIIATIVAENANYRLAQMLKEAPEVFGDPDVPNSWGLSQTGWCDKPLTHKARLVCIEKIGGGE